MAHILLIDDISGVRRSISSVLEAAGHKVTEAESGPEGLEAASAQRFDLVITDILMPGMDGVEVILALKARPNCPAIVAISGGGAYVPSDIGLLIAREEADIAMPKPLESEELLKTVGRLLQKKAA